MHTRSPKIKYQIVLETHRERAWEMREWAAGRHSIGGAWINPDGWILYDMWLKTGAWHGEFNLVLIEGGSVVETYALSEDEWRNFPGMPSGWDIPF